MNNKFSLSFGVSLVAVGLLNAFFDINSIILFGLSISAIIFSLINVIVSTFDRKNLELLYIIPFVILISIFCYNDSLMKIGILFNIVSGKTTGILTFVSFGFLFISSFFYYRKEKLSEIIFNIERVNQEYEYCTIMLNQINRYISNLNKKKIIIDEESKAFLNAIDSLCNERAKLASINASLLKLKKNKYALNEINEIYKKNNDILNYEKNISKSDN